MTAIDMWGWGFTIVLIVLLAWYGWRQHNSRPFWWQQRRKQSRE